MWRERPGIEYLQTVATKEQKRQAKGLIESLESRVHAGPPIDRGEIRCVQEFLRDHDFSPASDYFSRLGQVQERLVSRVPQAASPNGKRNYGGEAAGCWLQVQSAYDHVIVSTCYQGEFNLRRGRIKVSHRFNREGRIDFVETKLLRSLDPGLDGAIRKLVMIKDYQTQPHAWFAAEAFVLRVLPRELVFLYEDLFRCSRNQHLAWLINIGHRLAADVIHDLGSRPANGYHLATTANPNQFALGCLRDDKVAWPILERAAGLEASVEVLEETAIELRYLRKLAAR